jgi:ribosomal RNA-processing protein 36
VSFEQLAEIKNKMGIKEFSQTRTTKATTANDAPIKKKAVVSKAQILKDLREATGQRARATKEEMKRDSKHR